MPLTLAFVALALLAVLCVLVAVACGLGYLLLQQGGRVLLRLEALDERLTHLEERPRTLPRLGDHAMRANGRVERPRQGLPKGALAPPWVLPDLAGTPTALASFLGQRLLLVFFNPHCGFCAALATDLAALPVDVPAGQPLPVVITTGEREINREWVREHGLRCPVLLEEGLQVASQYGAHGTPIGCLVDEHGAIASELAVGAAAVLALARQAPEKRAMGGHAPANGVVNATAPPAHRGNRSLAESKINRAGLVAGSLAPAFRLPRLGGGELSLEEYQGQEILLVFSDPRCGPCDALAPKLEAQHRQRPDARILMVSRGEEAENYQKVADHGLTFPIALQQKWEVSRLYEIYATPVGFLIGTDGRTVANVAQGPERILELLTRLDAGRASSPHPPREPVGQPQ
jgi:peroxiredoxin